MSLFVSVDGSTMTSLFFVLIRTSNISINFSSSSAYSRALNVLFIELKKPPEVPFKNFREIDLTKRKKAFYLFLPEAADYELLLMAA